MGYQVNTINVGIKISVPDISDAEAEALNKQFMKGLSLSIHNLMLKSMEKEFGPQWAARAYPAIRVEYS
jgi:hypothetical protein